VPTSQFKCSFSVENFSKEKVNILSFLIISQQITLSGEEAKKASTMGFIFLQGPHQVAPILIITKPGFFSNKLMKCSLL
jgi:hypothetical protein